MAPRERVEAILQRQGPFLWLYAAFAAYLAAVAAAIAFLADGLNGSGSSVALTALGAVIVVLSVVLLAVVMRIIIVGWSTPASRMAVDVRALAHGEPGAAFEPGRYPNSPGLATAIGELTALLVAARRDVGCAVDAATAEVETVKRRLAAILNDLHEGVVVCNGKHQVVLYNQKALGALHVAGQIGLGRPLSGLIVIEPVWHAYDLLLRRSMGDTVSVPFVSGTTDGRSLLQGRMSLIRAPGAPSGYVLTFNDVTDQVSALARRDAVLRELVDTVRDSLSRLDAGGGHVDGRAASDMKQAADRAGKSYQTLLTGWWPMFDTYSSDLFDLVIRRLDRSGLEVTLTGLPIWLHCDSHMLVLALEALLRRIAAGTGAAEFDVAATAGEGRGRILISWQGAQVDGQTLRDWQGVTVSPLFGGMTVRDVMMHHTDEEIVEQVADGTVTLVLALPLGHEGQDRPASVDPLPPRPEFFDFDLLAQAHSGDLGRVRLRDLTYVVFDTETTGLLPTQGDQVVSIAAVRIVNGRILTGETFNRIVNPGRPIPPDSVTFHGITDDMVVDKPPLAVVLPQFKAFVADAVMVGHNVAFDLKFLRLRERESGISFDNPVLDTMLLSFFVDGTVEDQSLDAIARRYGIALTDRHTALGDSLVTAAILLRLIGALEAKGTRTLNDAMTTLNMAMELHNRIVTMQ
jgi:DNA polymerase-3 subunit epsilon